MKKRYSGKATLIGCKGVRRRRADPRGFKDSRRGVRTRDSFDSIRSRLWILIFIRTVGLVI